MALLLIIVQTLILVPLMALFAQVLVGLFNWHSRHGNPVFQMLGIVARPALRVVRLLTPSVVSDRHLPWLAFGVLVAAYLTVGLAHRSVCQTNPLQSSCERWATARAANR